MAGHSKWANIKHKKAKSDEKRGKEFTKIAKEIVIAVKSGGSGDPDANPKLKLAIQKAKAVNMPNENINRAISKGLGETDAEAIEEIIYEGYAPAGVAVLLEIATDNRNRTASEIRHLFSKNNGNMGESGCVAWMFKRVGLITVNKENVADEDEFMLLAIEAGAEDVKDEGEYFEIITSPDDFMQVKENLEANNIKINVADLVRIADNTVEVTDEETAAKILKLIELLEDHDDVQNVYTNVSIPDEIMERLA